MATIAIKVKSVAYDILHSIVTNGICWELYSGDGRRVSKDKISISADELSKAKSIADRVLSDLGLMERGEAK